MPSNLCVQRVVRKALVTSALATPNVAPVFASVVPAKTLKKRKRLRPHYYSGGLYFLTCKDGPARRERRRRKRQRERKNRRAEERTKEEGGKEEGRGNASGGVEKASRKGERRRRRWRNARKQERGEEGRDRRR
jgi:hypothetical protein